MCGREGGEEVQTSEVRKEKKNRGGQALNEVSKQRSVQSPKIAVSGSPSQQQNEQKPKSFDYFQQIFCGFCS